MFSPAFLGSLQPAELLQRPTTVHGSGIERQVVQGRLADTAPGAADVLNVSTSDGFAGRWLVPRLYRFRRAHSDIDVRISTSGLLADFVRDGIDIAIRYSGSTYDGAWRTSRRGAENGGGTNTLAGDAL